MQNIDDFFDEELPNYECSMCDDIATYRTLCHESECDYLCDEDLELGTCPDCIVTRLER